MKTQKDIVLQIVKEAGSSGLRTEQVQIQGLYKGITDSSRLLRYLQKENEVESQSKDGDKTYTWYVRKPKPIQQTLKINNA